MKNLSRYITESKGYFAECTVDVGPGELDEFSKLLKELEMDEVIHICYGGGTIILRVPEDAVSDEDYAVAYLQELKSKVTKWRFGQIKTI